MLPINLPGEFSVLGLLIPFIKNVSCVPAAAKPPIPKPHGICIVSPSPKSNLANLNHLDESSNTVLLLPSSSSPPINMARTGTTIPIPIREATVAFALACCFSKDFL